MGLSVVVNLDENEAYQFNILYVVKDNRTGDIYAANDSGCSCPIPFENHKFPDDYTLIGSVEDFEKFLKELGTYPNWPLSDVLDSIQKVKLALNEYDSF